MALDHDRLAVQPAAGVDDRVVQAGVLLRALQAVGVRLQIGKFSGIGGDQVVVLGSYLPSSSR